MVNIFDKTDDHAQRINVLSQANVRMDAVKKWMVASDSTDGLIMEGLKRLETTVTEQGMAIPAFSAHVQGAVKDIAGFMERVAAQTGGWPSVSSGATHDDLRGVQARGEEAHRRLERCTGT